MIRGKFLAQDDFDLAGHRFRNWQWIADLPTREGSDGQIVAIVDGAAQWVTATADGLVIVEWADILNKPTEFTPEAHTHPWDEVTGKPTFVNSLTVGTGLQTTAATGNITVGLSDDMIETMKFFIGAVIGSPIVAVTSAAGTITLTVTSASNALTLIYSDDRPILDVTGGISIALTAGTDAVPVLNKIWIPKDTQVLTKGATWPSGVEYVPIATVFCQSAASAATDGLYKVHAWTDHTYKTDETGHLAHITHWIREQNASWHSGAQVSPTLGAAQFDIATSAGIVMQLHEHTFPALTTVASVDPLFVVNDSVTAYKRVANMVSQLLDSAGATLSNKYYSIVVWGVVSEDAVDCQLMVNLPTGSYLTAASAQADASVYAVYGIPESFRGCGFLIARLVVKHAPAGNTYTLVESIDLRGTSPQGFGGGSSGSGDHGGLIGLSDPDHPLTALQQSGASTGNAPIWNGTTWTPGGVVEIRANGLTDALASGVPSTSHLIMMQVSVGGGGSMRYAALAALPISTPVQLALNTKSDTTHTHSASELTQTAATTGQFLQWTGSTWLPNSASSAPIDTIAANAPLSANTSIGNVTLTFSGSPSDVGAAALTHTHSVSDLTQTSATTGQHIAWSGATWLPATPAGGSNPTMSKMIYIETPSATTVYPMFTVSGTSTLSKVTYQTDVGNVTFNIEERGSGTPNTAGTDVLSADHSATATEVQTSTFSNTSLAAESWAYFVASAVSGTPTKVWIRAFYTED